jgi:polyamine oxidase
LQRFSIGTYTKVCFLFHETFWPRDTQNFLHADPTTNGYYPVWQLLSAPGFIDGSNIIFATVLSQAAYYVERQTDEQTKNEAIAVLGTMFPDINIPQPEAFMYPR